MAPLLPFNDREIRHLPLAAGRKSYIRFASRWRGTPTFLWQRMSPEAAQSGG
jgi:hypothetical protein